MVNNFISKHKPVVTIFTRGVTASNNIPSSWSLVTTLTSATPTHLDASLDHVHHPLAGAAPSKFFLLTLITVRRNRFDGVFPQNCLDDPRAPYMFRRDGTEVTDQDHLVTLEELDEIL